MDHVPALGAMAALVLITWLWGRAGQARLAKQAEALEQMLAKFQSGQELADFLETETGQRFMRQLESNPHGMILGTLSAGIVSCSIGLGFIALTAYFGDYLLIPAVGALAVGIGLVAAALISKRLSRQWESAS